MSANSFNQDERVLWEKICTAFDDQVVISNLATVVQNSQVDSARAGDTFWRPMPYILPSYSGLDQSSNFTSRTQTSVPVSMSTPQAVPFVMDYLDARDPLQTQRLVEAAKDKLASDINIAVQNEICNKGTLVVKRTVAATGFSDIGLAKAIMDEQGVPMPSRCIALATRDYIGMSGNLAARTVQDLTKDAYENGYVGRINAFEVYNLDYGNSLAAATGTTVTVTGTGTLSYVPVAQTAGVNVDNRTQSLNVTVSSGTIAVGDCFTIAGVNAVHHVTKQSTGQLKTFRVISLVSGAGGTGTIEISPPIIANSGSTVPELQYKNVNAAPVSGAAIVWLNTAAANINPFWHKSALELYPGKPAIPENAGVAVMSYISENKIPLTMQKFYDINTGKIKYRVDTHYGVALLNPEMAGLMLFSQS